MSIFRQGGEFFNRTVAQVLPAAKKAARIGITQGSALELALRRLGHPPVDRQQL
jgi:hypothetical protein